MIPSDRKTHLNIYKTLVEQNKFQLLEMSLRFDAMVIHLPDAISGDSYVQLDNYLKHVRSTLNACETLLKALDRRLTEIE